jgi:hypothetical protein
VERIFRGEFRPRVLVVTNDHWRFVPRSGSATSQLLLAAPA